MVHGLLQANGGVQIEGNVIRALYVVRDPDRLQPLAAAPEERVSEHPAVYSCAVPLTAGV